jgi:hypothetical protein
MWQASGKATGSARRRLHANRRPRDGLFEIRLPFFRFVVSHRWLGCLLRPPTILRERLTRQNDVIFTSTRWRSGWSAIMRTAIVVTTARIPPAWW